MLKVVYSVTNVELQIEKRNPPILVIKTDGEANSGGWTDFQLIGYVYIAPPADGIYDFDLVGEAPDDGEIVSGAITKIKPSVETEWSPFPADLKGVRVHSSTNSFTVTL